MKAIWDLGDGTISYDTNPVHTYAPGVYNVSVRVSGDLNNQSGNFYGSSQYGLQLYKGYMVHPNAGVDFSGTPLRGCAPLTVAFTLNAINPGRNEKLQYVHVTGWDYGTGGPDDTKMGLHVSKTNTCLRYALQAHQGSGWAEFGGDFWPFPQARVGVVSIFDDAEKEHTLVFDSRRGKVYEVGLRGVYEDGKGEYSEGHEIDGYIKFPEATGSAEHYFLKSLEHHVHFRPHGGTEYRDDFEVDYWLFKDGNVLPCMKTRKIPIDGDITFKHDEEAHRFQPQVNMSTSQWMLVKARDYYIAQDKASRPDDRWMTENDYQEMLMNCAIKLARNELSPLRNTATGGDFTGSYAALVDGPDGKIGSAMSFAGAQGLISDVSVDLSGDFTAMIWISTIAGSNVMVFEQSNGLRIAMSPVGSHYELTYTDALGNNVSCDLEWTNNTWVHIAVVRDGNMIKIYENAEIRTTQPCAVGMLAGHFTVMDGEIGRQEDFAIVNNAVSADALSYYYDDVIEKSGETTMPVF